MLGFALLAVVSTGGLHLGTAARPSGLCASTARHSRLLPRMTAGDSYDTNQVVLAARKGKTEALSELLAADRTAANTAVKCAKIPTMDGATPIIWAARQGKFEAVCAVLSLRRLAAPGCGPSPLASSCALPCACRWNCSSRALPM